MSPSIQQRRRPRRRAPPGPRRRARGHDSRAPPGRRCRAGRAPGGSRCRCGRPRRSRSRPAPRRRTPPASARRARAAAPRRRRCRAGGRRGPCRWASESVDHRRHHRRHLHHDGRAVQRDQLEEPLRRRPLGEDDPGAADAERKERGQVARVAEEELRHGQHDVVLGQAEHAECVPLEAEERVVRGMHRRLRRAGAPGRELPEGDVVLVVGAGSSSSGACSSSASKQHSSTTSAVAAQPGDLARVRRSCRACSVHDHDARARVVEVVRVVLRLEERVHLGDDGADLQRAEPGRDEARPSERASRTRSSGRTPSSRRTWPLPVRERASSAYVGRPRRRSGRCGRRAPPRGCGRGSTSRG